MYYVYVYVCRYIYHACECCILYASVHMCMYLFVHIYVCMMVYLFMWANVIPCDLILSHDDVIKWKHFPRYWPFVRGIHLSPVNSPHKGQWRRALMFSSDLRLNKRLSKQSWGWWFETPSCPLWRQRNVMYMSNARSLAGNYNVQPFTSSTREHTKCSIMKCFE